jgi:hypothetical protein
MKIITFLQLFSLGKKARDYRQKWMEYEWLAVGYLKLTVRMLNVRNY